MPSLPLRLRPSAADLDRATVQIREPAVVGPLEGDATPGEGLTVRLAEADDETGRIRLARAVR